MKRQPKSQSSFLSLQLVSACAGLLLCCSCRSSDPVKIAVIPRTCGTPLWEPEHGGAEDSAVHTGAHIYWNAPTREDDVEGQIALVNRIIGEKKYQGLVLAPDQALALITPVQRALSHGIATVIVGSPLGIPPGGKLSYILNDDEEGGVLAAKRVAMLLHGQGSVAVLGMNPDITGIMIRARSFERFLSQNYPNIHIVEKRIGTFNVPHEREVVEETLNTHPNLSVLVALMWPTAHAAIDAVDANPEFRTMKIIAFDPDTFPSPDIPSLDSVILQDTRTMGRQAADLIHAELHGQSVPALIRLRPLLVNRDNIDTQAVRELTSMDWRPGPLHWDWNATP